MTLKYDKESIELPASWRSLAPVLIAAGLLSVLVGVALCLFAPGNSGDYTPGFKFAAHSYLTNFIFILTFALGALFFILVQFLARSGWSTAVRRLAEIIMTTMPYIAFCFIPVFWFLYSNSSALYEWNAPLETLSGPTKLKAAFYLSKGFFSLRAIVYFAAWIIMGTWFFHLSRQQDESGDAELSLIRQKWAGPFIMVFALSVSFAAFDWVMSIDADWFSTIYGVYLFAASMMAFFALMIVLSMSLQSAGKVTKFITVEHYHDMGKFLFGFIMFWSYIAFSQLLLYWYGNIPEETEWYRVRLMGSWTVYSYGLIFVHFAIPFLGLMSRHVRRHRTGLFFWACWVLVAHWLDMTYLIMPNATKDTQGLLYVVPMLGHVALGIGMSLIFCSFLLLRASNVPLVAVRDPRLPESLTYANQIL